MPLAFARLSHAFRSRCIAGSYDLILAVKMASGTLKTPGWILRSLPPPQFSSFSSAYKRHLLSYLCSNRGRGALAPCAEPTPRVLLQFFMRWQDCMLHGKVMSSLRLGTPAARPPPPPPQLAVKQSTMEEHRRRVTSRRGAVCSSS